VETVNRTDDIEAGCDPCFEQRWWRIERVCWVVMSVLLLGGVAGAFGNGPLSKSTVHPPGGQVEVRYARLARRETPALLELRFDKQPVAVGKVRVRLNRELVHRLRIKEIIPAPQATEPMADGARFTFTTDPTSDSSAVVFVQDPSTPGIVEGEVTVDGADPVRFRQFVYP
jgi:hypothetical protein